MQCPPNNVISALDVRPVLNPLTYVDSNSLLYLLPEFTQSLPHGPFPTPGLQVDSRVFTNMKNLIWIKSFEYFILVKARVVCLSDDAHR